MLTCIYVICLSKIKAFFVNLPFYVFYFLVFLSIDDIVNVLQLPLGRLHHQCLSMGYWEKTVRSRKISREKLRVKEILGGK